MKSNGLEFLLIKKPNEFSLFQGDLELMPPQNEELNPKPVIEMEQDYYDNIEDKYDHYKKTIYAAIVNRVFIKYEGVKLLKFD